MSKAGHWCNPLAQGQMFMIKYRENAKSPSKMPKITGMSSHIAKWNEFMKTEKLAIDSSFTLMVLKVAFLAFDGSSITDNLEHIIEQGLCEALSAIPKEAPQSANELLRVLLQQRFEVVLSTAAVDDTEQVADQF